MQTKSVQDGEMMDEPIKLTFPMKDYPQLEGLDAGAPFKATFEGQIDSIDGDQVTISGGLSGIETENEADRELAKQTGKKKEKMASPPPSDEEEPF